MPESSTACPEGGIDLRGRTALVTGGAVRIGRAISIALAGAGARVVIHYKSSSAEAEAAREEIEAAGGVAALIQADLSSVSEVRRLGEEAPQSFGPIDILVNNASIFPAERFEEVDEELWETAIAINLRAPFFLSQQMGAAMKARGGGVIINLADLAGIQSWSSYAAHSISKAGVIHLTKVAARALAPEVRVAAIAPGTVLPPESLTTEQIAELAVRAPLQRNGSPEDVVRALFYLLSAEFVTGEVLAVDGGRLLK